MILQKRWDFGLGTIFSLMVVYFIFLYSRDKGWGFLAFLSKWYLIVIGGLIGLSLAAILLAILFSLLIFLIAATKTKKFNKKYKKAHKDYIDAEYKVKE